MGGKTISTEIGYIPDCKDDNISIEIAVSSPEIRLFSTERKIWLDKEGAQTLIDTLQLALFMIKEKDDR